LAIIVCRLDDLGSSLRCYGPQIDQQARFCSLKKKNFYFVGKTQFLDVVTGFLLLIFFSTFSGCLWQQNRTV
jgi:hypothetical protein